MKGKKEGAEPFFYFSSKKRIKCSRGIVSIPEKPEDFPMPKTSSDLNRSFNGGP